MYVCMYINNKFIVYDKVQDWVVYLKSVENVITLGKLISLLFLFCLPLLSILLLKTKRKNLARPVMGTIFLVGDRSEPLSDKLGGDICIATRALVCIYLYNMRTA